MVADALNRRAESLGSLVYLPTTERQLALDVKALANQFVRLDVSKPSQVFACVVSQSSLIDLIREHQYNDPHLLLLKDTVQHDDAREVTIRDDGALRMQGGSQFVVLHSSRCHEDVSGHETTLLVEENEDRHNLNCQQVKYEHQWPGGLLQKLEIPECKWERITMNFAVRFPRTQMKFDAVWVFVDMLTKSAHCIPVMTTYSSE
ncbi:uncharacterized protein [Nicotiana sylvestris]|uniref:uncharacterized protein n=1 Tax=Nicotiana sylvestris TaxID=4096 RepID=UPI00388CD4A2